MADRANVTSIDALEAFRTSLIVFIEKANLSLAEAGDEITRARQWVQVEQRTRWNGEFKRRRKRLEEAQAELYSAHLSTMTKPSARLKQNVAKAERSLVEAEDKLRMLKKWSIAFDQQVSQRARKLDGLQSVIDQDMPKAVHYLNSSIEALAAYAEARPGSSTTRTAPGEESGAEANAAESGEGEVAE